VTDVKGSALADALRERYLLERELGAGGMATVYLAQDVRHHRRVALKVLKPELAAVIGAERFLHEIETTANLQHPHILPLHYSGEPEQDSTIQFVSLESGKVDTVRVGLGELPILDWAPDGSYGVGTRQVAQTGLDLMKWDRPRAGSQPQVLYATPSDEIQPRVSPDGRYLAYGSNQSGRNEVYLARLPTMTQHIQVSLDGAEAGATWSRDGRTLYFLGPGGTLISVSVITFPELRVGKPAPVAAAPTNIRDFEPAPDGRLLVLYDDQPAGAPLTLVENWAANVASH
jgi:dipeptidyl aminopeptidase/acylaminoacyl peptidase